MEINIDSSALSMEEYARGAAGESLRFAAEPQRAETVLALGSDYYLDACVKNLNSGRETQGLLNLALRYIAEFQEKGLCPDLSDPRSLKLYERFIEEAELIRGEIPDEQLLLMLKKAELEF